MEYTRGYMRYDLLAHKDSLFILKSERLLACLQFGCIYSLLTITYLCARSHIPLLLESIVKSPSFSSKAHRLDPSIVRNY
uniref:Uncharacterized protein n=1 Tax=Manihot esculenta TaxID=3983 RepID=A0A2C9UBP0_MANES